MEKLFGGWAAHEVPAWKIADAPQPKGGTIHLIDRPGSQQSIVLAGQILPPTNNPDKVAFETFNEILGGAFTSRINMNIRENKHWSYGSHTHVVEARGQRPLIVMAPVQGDKTAETVQEVKKELNEILTNRPVTAEELTRSKASLSLSLPGQWETDEAVVKSLSELVRFGLPADYFDTLPKTIEAMQLSDMAAVGKKLLHPESMAWVVVGDRAKVEPALRAAGFKDIKILDADGNPSCGQAIDAFPGSSARPGAPRRPARSPRRRHTSTRACRRRSAGSPARHAPVEWSPWGPRRRPD